MMVSKGNHPQIALVHVSELKQFPQIFQLSSSNGRAFQLQRSWSASHYSVMWQMEGSFLMTTKTMMNCWLNTMVDYLWLNTMVDYSWFVGARIPKIAIISGEWPMGTFIQEELTRSEWVEWRNPMFELFVFLFLNVDSLCTLLFLMVNFQTI